MKVLKLEDERAALGWIHSNGERIGGMLNACGDLFGDQWKREYVRLALLLRSSTGEILPGMVVVSEETPISDREAFCIQGSLSASIASTSSFRAKVEDGEVYVDLAHDPMVCVLSVTGKDENNEPNNVMLTLSTTELARIMSALSMATSEAIRLDTEAWALRQRYDKENEDDG